MQRRVGYVERLRKGKRTSLTGSKARRRLAKHRTVAPRKVCTNLPCRFKIANFVKREGARRVLRQPSFTPHHL